MKIDIDDRDVFDVAGPTHLFQGQWSHPNYRRAAIACLTQSVYVLEKDRQLNKVGIYALATKWYTHFHYQLLKLIRDVPGKQIVGALFEWTRNPSCSTSLPQVILAFRGTMPEGDGIESDLIADFYVLLQQLHTTPRFTTAVEEVRQAVKEYGLDNVSIAGHSLGASVCLLVGRTLAEEGKPIGTYLFNSPYASPPIERIRNRTGRLVLHALATVVTSGVAAFFQDKSSKEENFKAFVALKDWHPHLFLNVHDPICTSYVGYFLNRQFLLDTVKGTLPWMAPSLVASGALQALFKDSKPYHLIPSAHLNVIRNGSTEFKATHGLHQWWSRKAEIYSQTVSLDLEEYGPLGRNLHDT